MHLQMTLMEVMTLVSTALRDTAHWRFIRSKIGVLPVVRVCGGQTRARKDGATTCGVARRGGGSFARRARSLDFGHSFGHFFAQALYLSLIHI